MSKVFVKISQAGGNYGVFPCPICQGRVDFKFSNGAGWCGKCGATFHDYGYTPRFRAPGDPLKATYWRWLGVDR